MKTGKKLNKIKVHRERVRTHTDAQNGERLTGVNVSGTLWINTRTSLCSMRPQHLGLHSICWQELSMHPLIRSTV